MSNDSKIQLSIKDLVLVPGNRLISYGYQKSDEILVEEVIVVLYVTFKPRKASLIAQRTFLLQVISFPDPNFKRLPCLSSSTTRITLES